MKTIADSAITAMAAGQKDYKPVQIAGATLHLGDCLQVMRALPDNSVDSIVTDPPYGLSFMGKKWDYDVPDVAVWREALRILKPGGHLLAFAGTRTQHRMACRIEDAGFEIRDMIAWVYGSGFPKSMDVSKAIDKAAGAVREVTGYQPDVNGRMRHEEPSSTLNHAVVVDLNSGIIQRKTEITAPATEAARQWQGWGTALKPALEPITMARKPFACTVADNVLQHGTGALNIDASRVATEGESNPSIARRASAEVSGKSGMCMASANRIKQGLPAFNRDISQYVNGNPGESMGRWPANLIHDGSAEVDAVFPQSTSTGGLTQGIGCGDGRVYAMQGKAAYLSASAGGFGDTGSAARFFYSAKASKDDRNEGLHKFPAKAHPTMGQGIGNQPDRTIANNQNHHPTVKPTDLMHYLLRLVTPPGGTSLDPYMGSGSTGKAAAIGQFKFIGIERDPDYFAIACARLEYANAQGHLFGALA